MEFLLFFLFQIDKIKIQLTTEEATEFANKVKMVLEKKVRPKGKLADRERGGNKSLKKAVSFSSHQPKSNTTSIVEAKDSAKDRQLQSMTPTTKQIGHSLPAGNIMIEPPGAMNMTPTAVVGTMESTNYFIELSTAHPVKQNANTEFKNIMTHVLPKVDKPKLVNVDGAYYAEVPNEFNVPQTNQVGASLNYFLFFFHFYEALINMHVFSASIRYFSEHQSLFLF